MYSWYEPLQRIVLSLCDGMGCCALGLRNVQAEVDRYIGVEIDPVARLIADNVNPESTGFPGIDHSWHSDVLSITEADIAALGSNTIKLLAYGAPCEDMSKLRLLRKAGSSTTDPRPGLNGPKGQLFRACIQITAWVIEHNPDCEVFIENVDFSDMKQDWTEVNKALGLPMVINAANYSYTKRNRAYWTSFVLPEQNADLTNGFSPKTNPDECMDAGRSVQTYSAYGIDTVRPIGKSWKGHPDSPEANTSLPVMVTDERFEQSQHLKPQEAELLMGMPPGCTAGNGVSAKDRLKCVGNAWDMNVIHMLFRYSKLSCSSSVSLPVQATQHSQVAQPLHSTQATPCLNLEQLSQAVPIPLALTPDDEVVQATLVHMQQQGNSEFADMLMEHTPEHQMWYLGLIKHHYAQCLHTVEGSVLDSGSGKHLSSMVKVTDHHDRTSLSGFDTNSPGVWTEGTGYLPIQVVDQNTGEHSLIDVDDVGMLSSLSSPILSLGKLLRLAWIQLSL